MEFAVRPTTRVFKNYQHQDKIAELNRKIPVKTRQGQLDRVTFSEEARKKLNSSNSVNNTLPAEAPPPPPPKVEPVPESAASGFIPMFPRK